MSADNAEDETSVRVALRVRPMLPTDLADGASECVFSTPGEPMVFLGSERAFTFDHVFGTGASQDEIFAEIGVDRLVRGALDGLNGTVFAYGQTGSGKTHTMGTASLDLERDDASVGILPRAMRLLFAQVREALDSQRLVRAKVSASFIEIHREEVRDLLHAAAAGGGPAAAAADAAASESSGGGGGGSSSAAGAGAHVTIREDVNGAISLAGARTRELRSAEDALRCVQHGALGRATASTAMNAISSRSHAVFSLSVESDAPAAEGEPPVSRVAKLHFVDLAGSERLKRTKAEGERLQEGIHINRGLLALGNVICALTAERKPGAHVHVPYRESKLTRLLQDSLGGNARTVMLACVSPSDADFEETLNTLKYAHRARQIQNRAVVNVDVERASLEQLRLQVRSLQAQLASAQQAPGGGGAGAGGGGAGAGGGGGASGGTGVGMGKLSAEAGALARRCAQLEGQVGTLKTQLARAGAEIGRLHAQLVASGASTAPVPELSGSAVPQAGAVDAAGAAAPPSGGASAAPAADAPAPAGGDADGAAADPIDEADAAELEEQDIVFAQQQRRMAQQLDALSASLAAKEQLAAHFDVLARRGARGDASADADATAAEGAPAADAGAEASGAAAEGGGVAHAAAAQAEADALRGLVSRLQAEREGLLGALAAVHEAAAEPARPRTAGPDGAHAGRAPGARATAAAAGSGGGGSAGEARERLRTLEASLEGARKKLAASEALVRARASSDARLHALQSEIREMRAAKVGLMKQMRAAAADHLSSRRAREHELKQARRAERKLAAQLSKATGVAERQASVLKRRGEEVVAAHKKLRQQEAQLAAAARRDRIHAQVKPPLPPRPATAGGGGGSSERGAVAAADAGGGAAASDPPAWLDAVADSALALHKARAQLEAHVGARRAAKREMDGLDAAAHPFRQHGGASDGGAHDGGTGADAADAAAAGPPDEAPGGGAADGRRDALRCELAFRSEAISALQQRIVTLEKGRAAHDARLGAAAAVPARAREALSRALALAAEARASDDAASLRAAEAQAALKDALDVADGLSRELERARAEHARAQAGAERAHQAELAAVVDATAAQIDSAPAARDASATLAAAEADAARAAADAAALRARVLELEGELTRARSRVSDAAEAAPARPVLDEARRVPVAAPAAAAGRDDDSGGGSTDGGSEEDEGTEEEEEEESATSSEEEDDEDEEEAAGSDVDWIETEEARTVIPRASRARARPERAADGDAGTEERGGAASLAPTAAEAVAPTITTRRRAKASGGTPDASAADSPTTEPSPVASADSPAAPAPGASTAVVAAAAAPPKRAPLGAITNRAHQPRPAAGKGAAGAAATGKAAAQTKDAPSAAGAATTEVAGGAGATAVGAPSAPAVAAAVAGGGRRKALYVERRGKRDMAALFSGDE